MTGIPFIWVEMLESKLFRTIEEHELAVQATMNNGNLLKGIDFFKSTAMSALSKTY